MQTEKDLETACGGRIEKDEHQGGRDLRRWRWKVGDQLGDRGRPGDGTCVEGDMRRTNIREERVYDRQEWEGLIPRPTPCRKKNNNLANSGKRRRLNTLHPSPALITWMANAPLIYR